MRVFGPAMIVAAVACSAPAPGVVKPIGNQAATTESSGLAIGDYSCRIQESGYDYPPFRCVVRMDDGRYVLEKIEGSVRFRGVLDTTGTGFHFEGEVYCPWGDCTERVSGDFRDQGGVYIAQFSDRKTGPAMTVTVAPYEGRYDSYGYGGYEYGGDAYGGYGYGGFGYGGTGY